MRVVLVLIGLALAGMALWLATPPVARSEPQLICMGQGGPTVVLEAGVGAGSGYLEPLQRQVASFTRVCRNDRGGPPPRTSERFARELHDALNRAGERGPFVLVGHSFGGFTLRLFTQHYPGEVAGLVFVDAASEHLYARASWWLWLRLRLSDWRAGLRNAEAASFAESAGQVRACGGLGDRPVIVLTRGEPVRGDAELERLWRFELQPAMARLSSRGAQRFARHSGHFIPQQEPQEVVAAIRDVISALSKPAAR